jgi:phosphate starvation-inducible PhoH-like protein
MSKRMKGMTKKQASRIIEDEIGRYNDAKDVTKSVFENFQYLSNKEKSIIESKFAKPKNPSQARYVHCLNKLFNKIIIATGPAGTGKTLFGTEYGLKQFLFGKYDKIIFTRPAVSADEDLGYLPGTLEEKMAPWIRPIYDILYNFLSPNEVTQLIEDKKIEIAPLAYMRGRTFKNTWIIADEMQNSLPTQMKMLLTRLGENSRMVITGDLDQHDRHGEINGLADFLDKFKGNRSNSIVSVEFENDDIQREEVIKEILDIYAGDLPQDYTHYTDSDDSKSDSDDNQL